MGNKCTDMLCLHRCDSDSKTPLVTAGFPGMASDTLHLKTALRSFSFF